jgi:hypothetical protein
MSIVLASDRRVRRVAVGPLGWSACALLGACSTHGGAVGMKTGLGDANTPSSDDASLDTGASPDTDGGADESGGDDSAPVPQQTFLRVAQLSPDLPPIDVCIAAHGTTTFQGPLLAALSSSIFGTDAAATTGLAYAQVSAYLSVAPGPYDLRIVAAGATDCSTALTGASASALDGGALDGASLEDADTVAAVDADTVTDAGTEAVADAGTEAGTDAVLVPPAADAGLPAGMPLAPFSSNAYATVLIAGLLSPTGSDQGLTVTAIVDDSKLAGQAIALRAVNAMPSAPLLDFGLGSFSTSWLPLLTNVAFASASAHVGPSVGVVDTNGYLPLAPLSSQTVSARLSSGATSDAAIAKSMTLGSGSVATVVALGGSAGDTAHPAALLLCVDNAPSGGLLSDCSIAK